MRILLVFLMTILFLHSTIIHAEVYKYIDENGVVSFTDDFSNIPESQRPSAEKAPPASPAPSFVAPAPSPKDSFLEWLSQPLSKYIIGFTLLAVFMLFVQSRAEGFFLRLTVKVLFIGFLGAAIYTFLAARDSQGNRQNIVSPSSLLNTVRSALPDPSAISKVKKQVEQIKKRQEQEELRIQSLDNLQQSK